jgi:hypothetical protein
MKGQPKSEVHRRKISLANTGKPKTAEHKRKLAEARIVHGYSRHPHYNRHGKMMVRCYNPDYREFRYYGGRGITVYAEWHNLVTFCDWLDANLGPCPPGFSLDRIDNDGNYEPGNVRWASASEQSYNRRRWADTGMTHTPEHRQRIAESLRRRFAKADV